MDKMTGFGNNSDDEYRQEETNNIQKSINPDKEYMNDHDLCRVCHGKMTMCNRDDCPNK